ncbi:APC family permease [Rhodococcus fascians]|nr:APC family permease [Rhodococcus fascians]MBY3826519.1 APC family permease [Rhodococcus fascians]MBY3836980.1 APC family permease [Rhodococcus fascians]MBY3865553.1 APC family permease [Rhodococcus fascians]MBY3885662.1 APC family permease [Rhodococcus fascians]
MNRTDSSTAHTASLGTGMIVCIVLAAAAPLSVVAGAFPIGIGAGNGTSFPATYLVCTVILLTFAVGFAATGKFVRDGGAFASYIRLGLGRDAGNGSAFLALTSYLTIQFALYSLTGVTVSAMLSETQVRGVPWWAWSLITLAVVAILGYRNIEVSGKVLAVLVAAEVLIVVAIDAVVITRGGSAGMSTDFLSVGGFMDGAPGVALSFALAGFIGFEATAIFRNEARDPDRSIPRATYAAVIIIGVFYAVTSWAFISEWGAIGVVEQATTAPGTFLEDTAQRTIGGVGRDLSRVLLLTSLFACLLSFHNILSRYLHLMGGDLLPAALRRIHPRHASPHVASVITSTLGAALLIIGTVTKLDPVNQIFAWFANLAALGVLLLMLATNASILVYFGRHRDTVSVWRMLVWPAISSVLMAGMLFLALRNLSALTGGSQSVAFRLFAILLVAFVVGFALSRAKRADEQPPEPVTPVVEPSRDTREPA